MSLGKQTPNPNCSFSPSTPLQEDAPGFRKTSTLGEQIHCVVYVFDTCQLLCDEIIEKMAAIRKKTNLMNIPQLLLMTKVEEACPLVKENLSNVYHSEYIYKKAQQLSTALGIPLCCVLPVKNYSEELELSTDLLLLNAVQQMLHYADSFFDNQPESESDTEQEMTTNRNDV
ncbi:interferon-induced protein 44-like [Gadus chalcogrammus]|uniref:interferon-induced protein 44-like n=1 Tax=Gadus chalcogrammus TaxID=1042646 RepID=UPI0024C35579|nr:interferon-induced protein 44-like [Gadus chalcogrammus]